MTATNAKLAQGTRLIMADTASPAASASRYVAEVTSISGPTMSSDLIDVTSQESSGGFREKIIGLTDPGELTFDIFFNQLLNSHRAVNTPNPPGGLLYVFANKQIAFWQLQLPIVVATPMAIWQFAGVVNGFELDASVDDALKASVTIAISGLPSFSATAWTTPLVTMVEEGDLATMQEQLAREGIVRGGNRR